MFHREQNTPESCARVVGVSTRKMKSGYWNEEVRPPFDPVTVAG